MYWHAEWGGYPYKLMDQPIYWRHIMHIGRHSYTICKPADAPRYMRAGHWIMVIAGRLTVCLYLRAGRGSTVHPMLTAYWPLVSCYLRAGRHALVSSFQPWFRCYYKTGRHAICFMHAGSRASNLHVWPLSADIPILSRSCPIPLAIFTPAIMSISLIQNQKSKMTKTLIYETRLYN